MVRRAGEISDAIDGAVVLAFGLGQLNTAPVPCAFGRRLLALCWCKLRFAQKAHHSFSLTHDDGVSDGELVVLAIVQMLLLSQIGETRLNF